MLRAISSCLSMLDAAETADWAAVQAGWAQTMSEPLRTRLLSLVGGDRVIVGTQALRVLAKRVIRMSGPGTVASDAAALLGAIAMQGTFGAPDVEPGETPEERIRRYAIELARNGESNGRPDLGTRIAQAHLRWYEIPRDHGIEPDPRAAFELATTVALEDLQSVCFALYSHALAHPGALVEPAGVAGLLGWPESRVEAVLELISAAPATLAPLIEEEERRFGEQWSFDTLQRFPVLRLGAGQMVVLSPRYVWERGFGWLPFYDMTKSAGPGRQSKKQAAQAKAAFERVCEREVLESLLANAESDRKVARVFDGDALKAAFPGRRTADAAIAYGRAWVVVEVTAMRLKRESIVGGEEASLDWDLQKMAEETEQIASTIEQLRANPSRLAGDGRQRRRFVPVLVFAETFPRNPLLYEVLQERLGGVGELASADVAPLHVLDFEDLYVAEEMAERLHLGLLDVLDRQAQARLLRRVDLKSWAVQTGLGGERPKRLQRKLHPALQNLPDLAERMTRFGSSGEHRSASTAVPPPPAAPSALEPD